MVTHLKRAVPTESIPQYIPDPNELITSAEARRLSGGISDMSLWRWLKKGILPQPLKIERRRYWKRGEFVAALEAAGQNGQVQAHEARSGGAQ